MHILFCVNNIKFGTKCFVKVEQFVLPFIQMKAFVKQVREDGKVDLILQKPGFEKVDDFSKTLLEYIREHGGRINLNDKSPAEDIYDTFGVSKKTFKKGVGDLYKKRLISLHENGITLAES